MARVFLRSCSEGAQAALVQLQSSFLIFSNITAAGNCLGSLKSLPQKRRGPGSNESQIKGWLAASAINEEAVFFFLWKGRLWFSGTGWGTRQRD